jgi:acetyltransferase-like isoleucine patch superfamily enzyme
MKKIIKILLFLPQRLFNRGYNVLFFKIWGVNFSSFPRINGRAIIHSKKISFGSGVIINSNATNNPVGISKRTLFYGSGPIEIGNDVGISTSLFYANNHIKIEDDVFIGGGCQILDTDFHPLDFEKRIKKENEHTKSAPILIKRGAFIGTSSIILKGVTIGEMSIIAAGSVVSKAVPDGEIWGGNPAKFVRKIS